MLGGVFGKTEYVVDSASDISSFQDSIMSSLLREDDVTLEDRKYLESYNYEGTLELLTSGVLKKEKWKSCYFELKNGLFYHYSGTTKNSPVVTTWDTITMMTKLNYERPSLFEIASSASTLIVKAPTVDHARFWTNAITNASQFQLKLLQSADERRLHRQNAVELLHRLRNSRANQRCADCRAKDPTFTALDKGILLCRECASAHRRLDCSRVRSVISDPMHTHFIQIIEVLGNSFSNSVFEHSGHVSRDRPTPTSIDAARDDWVRNKYISKMYAPTDRSVYTKEHLAEEMGTACVGDDVRSLLFLISQGASVMGHCDTHNKLTPLHVAAHAGSLRACVFLIINGAEIDSVDTQGWTPLCHAVMESHAEVSHTLICYGARLFRAEMGTTSNMERIAILRQKQKTLASFFGNQEHFSHILTSQILSSAPRKYADFPLVTAQYMANDYESIDLSEMQRQIENHNVPEKPAGGGANSGAESGIDVSVTPPAPIAFVPKRRANTIAFGLARSSLKFEDEDDQARPPNASPAPMLDDTRVRYDYYMTHDQLLEFDISQAEVDHMSEGYHDNDNMTDGNSDDESFRDPAQSNASMMSANLSSGPAPALPLLGRSRAPSKLNAPIRRQSLMTISQAAKLLTLEEIQRGVIPPPPAHPPPDLIATLTQPLRSRTATADSAARTHSTVSAASGSAFPAVQIHRGSDDASNEASPTLPNTTVPKVKPGELFLAVKGTRETAQQQVGEPISPTAGGAGTQKEGGVSNRSASLASTSFPNSARTSTGDEVSRQGELLAWSKSRLGKGFKPAFFNLTDGQLCYFRKDRLRYNFDLLITTVRPTKDIAQLTASQARCCFEIITPHKSVLVQAASQVEAYQWMHSIQEATRIKLNRLKAERSHSRAMSNAFPRGSNGGRSIDTNENLYRVRADVSNRRCADCSEPNPDWCSLTMGVVICISCAGVHRSLGAHISKVRSLRIDRLPGNVASVLLELGNARSNHLLEARFPPGKRKAKSGDPDSRLREFILDKYQKRMFLGDPPEEGAQALLWKGVENADLNACLESILHGCDINEPRDDGLTCLMLGASRGKVVLVHLLVSWGADFTLVDGAGRSAVQYAQDYFNNPTNRASSKDMMEMMQTLGVQIKNKPRESQQDLLKVDEDEVFIDD